MYFFLLQIPNPKYDDTDTENESDFVLHPWSLNKNSRKLCKQSPAAHKVSQDFISSGNSKAIHQQSRMKMRTKLPLKLAKYSIEIRKRGNENWWNQNPHDEFSKCLIIVLWNKNIIFKKRSSFNFYQKTVNKQWIEDCYCVNIKHNIKQCAGKWRLLFWTTKNELAREKK